VPAGCHLEGREAELLAGRGRSCCCEQRLEVLRLRLRRVDEMLLDAPVFGIEQQDAPRRLSVSPRPADLLVVRRDRAWHVHVDDVAQV
jgi:hypothetical protein